MQTVESKASILQWIPRSIFEEGEQGQRCSRVACAAFYRPQFRGGAFLGNYQFYKTHEGPKRPYKRDCNQQLANGRVATLASFSSTIPGRVARMWVVGFGHSDRRQWHDDIRQSFDSVVDWGERGKPQDIRGWGNYLAVLHAQRVSVWDCGRDNVHRVCSILLPETAAKARELHFDHEQLQIWTDDHEVHVFRAAPENFKPECPSLTIVNQRLQCLQLAVKLPKQQVLALPRGLFWVEDTASELLEDIEVPAAYFYDVTFLTTTPLQLSKPEGFPSKCIGRYGVGLIEGGQAISFVTDAGSSDLSRPVAADVLDPDMTRLTPLESGLKRGLFVNGRKATPPREVFERTVGALSFSPRELVASFPTGWVVQGQRSAENVIWQMMVWVPSDQQAAPEVLYKAVWHSDSTLCGSGLSKQYVREGRFLHADDWVAWFDPLRASRFAYYDGESVRPAFVHYHPRGSSKAQDLWLFPNAEHATLDYLLLRGKHGALEHWTYPSKSTERQVAHILK